MGASPQPSPRPHVAVWRPRTHVLIVCVYECVCLCVQASVRTFSSSTAAKAYRAPLTEMRFLLDDVLDLQGHYGKLKATGGAEATPDLVEMILTESQCRVVAAVLHMSLTLLNPTSPRARRRQIRGKRIGAAERRR